MDRKKGNEKGLRETTNKKRKRVLYSRYKIPLICEIYLRRNFHIIVVQDPASLKN